MTAALDYLFMFFIFPGFLFSSFAGLVVCWIDRKLTARIQWRVGPPWYQNFIDIAKLIFCKETVIPEGVSRIFFLAMPVLGAASATLVSMIVLGVVAHPAVGFVGDLIVIVYLLLIPPIALMLGAFASGNTLASLGASREMKMVLAYELPFITALVVPVIKAGYAIRLGMIILYQEQNGLIIASLSGALSFIVALLAIQAKLGLTPFDIPEAETEIISGPYIEYSGKPLAIFKLTKAVLSFMLPVLLMALYLGGVQMTSPGSCATAAAQYLGIVVMTVLIKNTNPRVRIDHAMKFFWGPVTALAAVSLVLALIGL